MVHHCHALFCKTPCPPRMLMCGPCWAHVPPDMQREVYRTVKLRDMNAVDATWAPWWRASHRAIASVAVKRGHLNIDRYLKKELAFADKLEKMG